MTALIVRSIGPGASLQDAGRRGWQRYGVGLAGAMDRWSLGVANLLVGNGAGAAAIELMLAGGRFEVADGPVRVARAGIDGALKVDGREVAGLVSVTVPAGCVIEVGPARRGVFTYLAVAGGFAIAPQLGSLSLHARTGVGGLEGRALRPGDRLPLNLAAVGGPDVGLPPLPVADDAPIRVMLGPQDDHFSAAGIATFLESAYTITPQADRMGLRLAGPPIEHGARGYDIVSDGIPTGAIQVPGAGEPIIMMADRQTTGGYPKIAVVISADLPRLAQCRPGTALRFVAVDRDQAVAAARAQAVAFAALRQQLRPVGFAGLDSARLLALNLVDGWIDAGEG